MLTRRGRESGSSGALLGRRGRSVLTDVVVLATRRRLADKAPSLDEGIAVAAQSIDFGDAMGVLERLIESSNRP